MEMQASQSLPSGSPRFIKRPWNSMTNWESKTDDILVAGALPDKHCTRGNWNGLGMRPPRPISPTSHMVSPGEDDADLGQY